MFDLRPEHDLDGTKYVLRCSHGTAGTKMYVSDFFKTLKQWLAAHPTEFCIVTSELSATKDKTAWGKDFYALLTSDEFKGLFAGFKARLTVGEMRGKVLLLSKEVYADKPIGGYCYGWVSDLELEKQQQGHITAVDGSYEETFELSKAAIDKYGWYNRNAAINPYLSEGKKTVAHEICEQLGFEAPDFVAVSVGDGCTVAGVYKGLYDMYMVGLINKIPRIISVQAEGCCPINTAVMTGEEWQSQEENTYADSIAVGVPRNPDKAINAIKDSNGICVNVSDDEIREAQKYLAKNAGVFGEPAGVTATAGLIKLSREGKLDKGATIVSIVTGNGLKDIDSAIKSAGEPPHCKNDLAQFERLFFNEE